MRVAAEVHRPFRRTVHCRPIGVQVVADVHSNPEPDLLGHAWLRRTAMKSDSETLPSILQIVVLPEFLQKLPRKVCLHPSPVMPAAHFHVPAPSVAAFELIVAFGSPQPDPFVRSIHPRLAAFHVVRHAGV